MRILASLVVPVLALSACYNSYRGPDSGRDDYRYSDDRYSDDRWHDAADVPLAARIDQTGVGLAVRLNRPAYVAMFEIVPGQGVGLYYPSLSAERAYFPSGFTSLPRHGARRIDSYFTGMPARYSRGEPRFYFLVASRQPLRSISRFQRSNGALRSVLGVTAYTANNYRRVMDDLVQAVVPNQGDEDWTTDVLAVWPRDLGYYADNGAYQRVRCADGSVEILPLELARWGCRGQQRPTVVRAPRTNTPPTGGDSLSTVTPPSRRRPEPVADAPGEAQEGTRRTAPARRPAPEAAERPRIGDGEIASPATRAEGEERSERPRVEAPTREPRESPRAAPEATRAEPRREAPAPRSEPRETPRAEPTRSAPERSAPAPAPSPPPSRPERTRPAEPPAAG
jgi:hypothetical protein